MVSSTTKILQLISVMVYLLCLSCVGAKRSEETHRIQNVPGKISYFQQLQRSSELRHSVQLMQANQSLRRDVDRVLADFAQLRSLVEIGLQGESLLFQNKRSTESFGILHDYLQGWLRSSSFQAAQSQCVNDTGRIVVELLNGNTSYWAKQMLDSIGKPGPSIMEGRLVWVGNYKQCRSALAPPDPKTFSKGFSGAYTVISLYLSPVINQQGAQFQWGVCVPDTCDALQVYTLLKEALTAANLTSVSLGWPEIRTDEREVTTATVLSIVVLSLIGAMVILGTFYDIVVIQRPQWATAKTSKGETPQRNGAPSDGEFGRKSGPPGAVQNGISNRSTEEKKPLIPKPKEETDTGTMTKVLVAFSVYTNTTKFLNTRQAPGSLGAIHGIRFLSMSWVVLGHMYAFGMPSFVNSIDQVTLLKRWTFDAVSNALPSVDTFFTLSGLLTSYLAVKEITKRGLRINWGLFYFHRFWRLTPPYMLALLLALGLQRFLGSGALWANTQPQDKSFCEDDWWTNLLYINNIKNDKMCFGVSWYLANDMQFFVLSPLMIIPFYFHTYAGLASCLFFLLINWVTTGVVSTVEKMPPTFFEVGVDAEASTKYMQDYYIAPWCRIGPYVVGLAVGGLLAKTELRMSRMKNLIGWAIATATGLAVVWGLHEDINGDSKSSVAVAALYNAVSRSAWGACVCWVIVSCVTGYGGFVNSLLSWSPFVSLGRLTYMSYLIHPTVLYTYYGNMDELFYVNNFNIVISYLGVLLLVNMCAFVAMLGLESPMIGLEKALLPQRRK